MTDGTDIVDALRAEHDRLVGMLEDAFAAIGTARHEMLERLHARVLIHLAAERRVLDPAVRAHVEGGRHVLASLRQHDERLAPLFGRLAVLGDYAEEYTDVLVCLETCLLGHRAVADADVHPRLREATTPAERRRLGAELLELSEQLSSPSAAWWRRRPARVRTA